MGVVGLNPAGVSKYFSTPSDQLMENPSGEKRYLAAFLRGPLRVRPEKYRPRMVCPSCIEARNKWLMEHCPTWAEFQDLDGL
ncbi:MAG: hypothetical protein ACE5HC_17340 [Candidatus Binatia bacterium]